MTRIRDESIFGSKMGENVSSGFGIRDPTTVHP